MYSVQWLKRYMVYRYFKDLPTRTPSNTVLRDIAFNIAKNPKYDGYQHGIASMVCKYFDIKSASHTGTGFNSTSNSRN